MKLVFCGTPEFAVGTLEAVLAAGHEVALVVTQPDRAAGRGMEMQAPPVKRTALAHGIPVVQPEKIKNNVEFRAQLEAIQPDAILVVAYGRIIPQWMLDLPRYGNINLHGSLLPKYQRCRADSVGGGERRVGDGRDHDAARGGARYRADAAGAGGAGGAGGDGGGCLRDAGGDGRGVDGGDAGGARGGDDYAGGAGSCAGDAGADPDARGWMDRFCTDREADLRPLARVSAVAGGAYDAAREEADRASDAVGGCGGEVRGRA